MFRALELGSVLFLSQHICIAVGGRLVARTRTEGNLRIADDDGGANSSGRARVLDAFVPKANDEIESGNFKGDEQGFIDEKVPANHETKGIVDKVTSETDETTRDGVENSHLGNRVVDEAEDQRIKGKCDEKTGGTALGETSTDTDEERGTDGATDGDELDLTVIQAALKAVSVVAHVDFAVETRGGAGHLHLGVLILVGGRHVCDGVRGRLLLLLMLMWGSKPRAVVTKPGCGQAQSELRRETDWC